MLVPILDFYQVIFQKSKKITNFSNHFSHNFNYFYSTSTNSLSAILYFIRNILAISAQSEILSKNFQNEYFHEKSAKKIRHREVTRDIQLENTMKDEIGIHITCLKYWLNMRFFQVIFQKLKKYSFLIPFTKIILFLEMLHI